MIGRKFSVRIEGRNCAILSVEENRARKLGFFTTRFVEAIDEVDAAEIAVRLVEDELTSQSTLCNEIDDPPIFSVEWVKQVDRFERPAPGKGFTFYLEDT